MTAAEPFQAKPNTAQHTVVLDRIEHVFRASRPVTASGGEKRRYKHLVAFEGRDHDYLHRAKTFPTSRHKSSKGASSTLRRGLKTIAQPAAAASNWRRTASRIRRFKRFRSTALPSARGTVKPKRAGAAASSSRCKQKTAK